MDLATRLLTVVTVGNVSDGASHLSRKLTLKTESQVSSAACFDCAAIEVIDHRWPSRCATLKVRSQSAVIRGGLATFCSTPQSLLIGSRESHTVCVAGQAVAKSSQPVAIGCRSRPIAKNAAIADTAAMQRRRRT